MKKNLQITADHQTVLRRRMDRLAIRNEVREQSFAHSGLRHALLQAALTSSIIALLPARFRLG
jgi:hypothetical protein